MSNDIKITIRIPPELHEQVARLAEESRRSLNSTVLVALESYAKNQSQGKA